jgi:predicted nucleic acid-binding protein
VIFVDTGAFLGWFCPNDQHHDAACKSWADLNARPQKLVTSNFVIDETITLLGRRTSHQYAADRAEDIFSSNVLHIIQTEERHQAVAVALFRKFADQSISFTDCVSFAMMAELEISEAFTFDHHFRIAGFTVLP